MNKPFATPELQAAFEAQRPADTYDFWRNALAGIIGPIHDSDPQPGFYRKRMYRGGPFSRVAIWEHENQMVAVIDGKPADANDVWTYCCTNPVTEEAFRAHEATGKWHDEDAGLSASLAPPSIGSNHPPQDEADILRAQIDAASANAEAYTNITDDETASKAQSARARLNELSGQADKRREALKRTPLDECKRIDARWQPLVKAAKAAADAIAKALGAHETRKANEAVRRVREAQRIAAEAEAAARMAAEAGNLMAAMLAKPPQPTPPTPAVTQIRGAYGKAASVKVVKIATVKDYDEATTYFRNDAEYRAVIDKLAQRAVDAGYDVPGVTVSEQRKVI